MFKYLNYFPQMQILTRTLGAAVKPLTTFSIIMIIVLIAFGQAFYLAFGLDISEYRTIFSSMLTLVRMTVGDFDYMALENSHFMMGPLLFFMYTFFMIFIMMSVFIALISESYDAAKTAMKVEKEPGLRRHIIDEEWKQRKIRLEAETKLEAFSTLISEPLYSKLKDAMELNAWNLSSHERQKLSKYDSKYEWDRLQTVHNKHGGIVNMLVSKGMMDPGELNQANDETKPRLTDKVENLAARSVQAVLKARQTVEQGVSSTAKSAGSHTASAMQRLRWLGCKRMLRRKYRVRRFVQSKAAQTDRTTNSQDSRQGNSPSTGRSRSKSVYGSAEMRTEDQPLDVDNGIPLNTKVVVESHGTGIVRDWKQMCCIGDVHVIEFVEGKFQGQQKKLRLVAASVKPLDIFDEEAMEMEKLLSPIADTLQAIRAANRRIAKLERENQQTAGNWETARRVILKRRSSEALRDLALTIHCDEKAVERAIKCDTKLERKHVLVELIIAQEKIRGETHEEGDDGPVESLLTKQTLRAKRTRDMIEGIVLKEAAMATIPQTPAGSSVGEPSSDGSAGKKRDWLDGAEAVIGKGEP